jgi:gluconolactonase
MRNVLMLSTALFGKSLFASQYLRGLPAEFQTNTSKWAWVSYDSPSVAVLPGSFNRSVFDAPHESKVSDDGVAQAFVSHSLRDVPY